MTTEVDRVGACRSCGADVVFRTNPVTGKSPPWDHPPQRCADCRGIGFVIVQGQYNYQQVSCKPCKGEGRIWISHFATCPQANKWRGKSK